MWWDCYSFTGFCKGKVEGFRLIENILRLVDLRGFAAPISRPHQWPLHRSRRSRRRRHAGPGHAGGGGDARRGVEGHRPGEARHPGAAAAHRRAAGRWHHGGHAGHVGCVSAVDGLGGDVQGSSRDVPEMLGFLCFFGVCRKI